VLSLIHALIQLFRPYLVPFCFLCTWGAIALTIISVYRTIKNGIKEINYLHSIPCPRCQFFTNDYRLKCTVHPEIANSVTAISCADFSPEKLFY